jgi:hypothetical protein
VYITVHNKKTLVVGLKMVFKRNYNIVIDSYNIDSKLTYSENFNNLYTLYLKPHANDYNQYV